MSLPELSRGRRRHKFANDERGSALILALVMIIVVSVAGAAVLEQQQSAPHIHSAYENARTLSVTVDQAGEAVLQGLRYRGDIGVSSSAGGTGDCSDYTTSTSLPGFAYNSQGRSVVVYCRADQQSGAAIGGAAPRRHNRKMYIELRDANDTTKVFLRECVEMGDDDMQNIGMFPPKILSSVENPPS